MPQLTSLGLCSSLSGLVRPLRHDYLSFPVGIALFGLKIKQASNVIIQVKYIVAIRVTMQTSKPVQKSHDGEERFLKDMQFGSIDWSKLRPPASCHETEEDSLSTTSTIDYDYYYTDEEYPSTTDDEDDERPTDEEVKKVISYLDSQLGLSHRESRNEWPDKDEWVASWKEVPPPSRWTWINVFAYFKKGQGYGGYGVILRNAVAKPIIASAKFSKDGKSFFIKYLWE
ncbi:hypothetical protein MKW98_014209 [Papaver atlanticum]|uniref:Uncharacterized protein n=1 Tax=Papaver atlanticum TaxID=357466 RepID=A0AAD4XGA6_9MAGN|nr:hypothetical protein MKW98_014209 [Papaver atlanticum]